MDSFVVKGVSRTDRGDVRLVVNAESAENARVKAELDGVTVTSVTPFAQQGQLRNGSLRSCNPWSVMLLSMLTLSIYGAIWFYETGKSYARMAQQEERTNFSALFWWYFGTSLLGGLTLSLGFGVLLLISSFVLGFLVLGEFIRLRDECATQLGVQNALTSAATHRSLWTIGYILSLVLVGIFVLIAQAMLLISDHNTLAKLASANRAQSSG